MLPFFPSNAHDVTNVQICFGFIKNAKPISAFAKMEPVSLRRSFSLCVCVLMEPTCMHVWTLPLLSLDFPVLRIGRSFESKAATTTQKFNIGHHPNYVQCSFFFFLKKKSSLNFEIVYLYYISSLSISKQPKHCICNSHLSSSAVFDKMCQTLCWPTNDFFPTIFYCIEICIISNLVRERWYANPRD